ncbi:Peptidase M30, hyicolysin [Spirochaeta thermophila DSM 6578]|uniref:Peptidase M30, hyicolysin n=1 Tax=Winmispira thermophila (strain ATCC 700085 / DSM 6578 / Z-1203) TaxID=869211 RepID=G0GDU5_WINT7|nr:peptidase M30 [Spirochaeta thermophila]AEJ62225.1 Peptidase M30, hyicolysin [Spirochaeta thermophila DSM 6578]
MKRMLWLSVGLLMGVSLSCSFFFPETEPLASHAGIVRLSSSGSFDYTVALEEPRDVYFVFSAAPSYSGAQVVSVAPLMVDGVRLPQPGALRLPAVFPEPASIEARIANENARLARLLLSRGTRRTLPRAALTPSEMRADTVGETDAFYDVADTIRSVSATCRYVGTEDTPQGLRTLSIWVADDQWGTITQAMVDELAARFLSSGLDNDIYDWLTTILGPEWGGHPYVDLIPFDGGITIFLTDIGNDGSTEGGIVGYFAAIHQFKNEYLQQYGESPVSNERVMFTIDAPMYANDGGDGMWTPSDEWPKIVFSTLVHEFQHMINFYQKTVLRGGISEVWLNEMCSQVAEDLLADKVGVEGPRGVDPQVGGPGDPGNTGGRIPYYNQYTYLPLMKTEGFDLLDYATTYAFGAWTVRNFGGAFFLRRVVQSPYGGKDAVEKAVQEAGGVYTTMADLVAQWAVAVLTSDRTDMPEGYRYNTGTWFTSTLGGTEYRLGSIDFFRYYRRTEDGEVISEPGPVVYEGEDPLGELSAASNVFYAAARSFTGKKTFHLTVPQGVITHVVILPPR